MNNNIYDLLIVCDYRLYTRENKNESEVLKYFNNENIKVLEVYKNNRKNTKNFIKKHKLLIPIEYIK